MEIPTPQQLETLKGVLTHFRRSSEILVMRKKCRLDLEQARQQFPSSVILLEHELQILDSELKRRGLRR